MSLYNDVQQAFDASYNSPPTAIVRAPGRVNLIGEHTDYNDGFVMPMAINRAVWIALRPRNDQRVHIKSLDFPDAIDIDLAHLEKAKASPTEYVKGVAWALQSAGYALQGFDGVMKGDVPIGAGLSSSAALELATARAFAHVSGWEWSASAMALLAQKAENQWVGVNSGIMDQMISAAGQAGHALLIDCRSLVGDPVPLPDHTAIIVLDTGTRRELVTSAYNERRQQCEAAARHFGVPALRDVSIDAFHAGKAGLQDVTRRRARHIVTENQRVLDARTAMRANDPQALGDLMQASHVSLRDDFEVSSDALDSIVAIANAHDACYGARMTGAGFGGCAVALIADGAVDDFVATVSQQYTTATPHTPAIYVCEATAGAELLMVE